MEMCLFKCLTHEEEKNYRCHRRCPPQKIMHILASYACDGVVNLIHFNLIEMILLNINIHISIDNKKRKTVTIIINHQSSGANPGFFFLNRGGAKDCVRSAHITSAKSLAAGRAPGSLGFRCSLVLSEPYSEAFSYKTGVEDIVDQNRGGGGLVPAWMDPPLVTVLLFLKREMLFLF